MSGNTVGEMISQGFKKITADYTREKKKAHGRREDYVSQRQIDRWNKQDQDKELKAAAYKVTQPESESVDHRWHVRGKWRMARVHFHRSLLSNWRVGAVVARGRCQD
jgi:hypothetical protein